MYDVMSTWLFNRCTPACSGQNSEHVPRSTFPMLDVITVVYTSGRADTERGIIKLVGELDLHTIVEGQGLKPN